MVESWYPTVYFYDMEEGRIFWWVHGGEAFVKMTSKPRAMVLSNRIWTKLDEREYNDLVESDQDFSRFEHFASGVIEVDYMQSPIMEGLFDTEPLSRKSAPRVVTHSAYKLKFGLNKNLCLTEGCKVVEAHMHAVDKGPDTKLQVDRGLTLVYPGLGAFTFALHEGRSLTEKGDWLVQFDKQEFRLPIQFNAIKNTASGEGLDEHEKRVTLHLGIERKERCHWEAFVDTEGGTERFMIPDLAVDAQKR